MSKDPYAEKPDKGFEKLLKSDDVVEEGPPPNVLTMPEPISIEVFEIEVEETPARPLEDVDPPLVTEAAEDPEDDPR